MVAKTSFKSTPPGDFFNISLVQQCSNIQTFKQTNKYNMAKFFIVSKWKKIPKKMCELFSQRSVVFENFFFEVKCFFSQKKKTVNYWVAREFLTPNAKSSR